MYAVMGSLQSRPGAVCTFVGVAISQNCGTPLLMRRNWNGFVLLAQDLCAAGAEGGMLGALADGVAVNPAALALLAIRFCDCDL